MLNDEDRSKLDIGFEKKTLDPGRNLYKASLFDPDKKAEVIALSESRKLPMNAVENNLDKVKSMEKRDAIDLDGYPKTSNYLARDEKNSMVSFDDIDNLKGLEGLVKRQDDSSFFEDLVNSGKGALDRLNSITGNFLEFAGHIDENISSTMNDFGIANPGINFGDDGMSWSWDLGTGYKSMVKEVGKAVSDDSVSTYGYIPKHTWEGFKGDMTVGNLVNYALETFVVSSPDMLASIVALPAYVASRTEEFAEGRVKNDGRDEVENSDLIKGFIPALTVAMMERVSTKFIFRGAIDKARGKASSIALGVGSGAIAEGGMEFFQEGIEYLGETVGTKKELSVAEMLDRSLAGMVGGAVPGGGIKGTSTAYDVFTRKTNEKIMKGLVSDDEQGVIDQLIKFSQGSTTRERKGDRFQDFVDSLGAKNRIHISNEAISDAIEAGIEFPAYITDQLDGFGTDISITVGQFSTDIASNDEALSIIREHIKLNEFTLTQSEMNDDDNESIKNLMEKANAERNDLTESEKIFQDVESQLNDTNRQTREQSKLGASLVTKAFVQYSKKIGKGIKETYQSMGFTVESPSGKKDGETQSKNEFNETNSGLSLNQDFGDIMIENQSAQKVWDLNVKKQKQAQLLKKCLVGV